MIEIPQAVQAAAANHSRHESLQPSPIQRGDIRVVAAEGESRLVLVLSVDSDNEFADVLLLHSSPEFATDADGVLSTTDLGLPYPLVVQTDVRAAIWTLQIRDAIERVPAAVFAELNGIVRGDGPGPMAGSQPDSLYRVRQIDGGA